MKPLKLFLYSYALAMNVVVGALFLIATRRFAGESSNALQGALAVAMWSGTYAVLSFAIGGRLKKENAERWLIFGTALTAAASVGFVVFPQIMMQYFWIFLVGVGFAFYCTPFQMIMREAEEGEHNGIARAVALYSFSYSFGVAAGPFIAGMLWNIHPEYGWKAAYLLNALLAAAIALTVRPLRRYMARNRTAPSVDATFDHALKLDAENSPVTSAMPDLAPLGWTMLVVGMCGISLIRSLFPYKSTVLEISIADLGAITALVYFTHSGFSLLLIRSREWMYRPFFPVLFTLSGLAAMLLFGWGQAVWQFYLAAMLMGLFSGMYGFCFGFFSLSHPTRSARYVSINEALVGVVGVAAPIAGGILGNLVGFNLPFLYCAGLVVLLIGLELLTYRLARKARNFA